MQNSSQEYCDKEAVYVPPSFKRHTASHLVVIPSDSGEPKLVAKTFCKKEDLKYYIAISVHELIPSPDANGQHFLAFGNTYMDIVNLGKNSE